MSQEQANEEEKVMMNDLNTSKSRSVSTNIQIKKYKKILLILFSVLIVSFIDICNE